MCPYSEGGDRDVPLWHVYVREHRNELLTVVTLCDSFVTCSSVCECLSVVSGFVELYVTRMDTVCL